MFKMQKSQRRDYSRNIYVDIELPLKPEYYRRKFLALIQCEKQEHIRLLREKCNGSYHIKCVSKADHKFHLGENYVGYFSIQGMSPRQILYASQASKSVSIKCRNGNIHAEIAYLNEHYDVSNDALYIATDSRNTRLLERSWLHLRSKSFKIEFKVKHSYFKQLENAIQNISDDTILRIVPSNNDFEEGLEDEWIPRSQFYRHRLDKFQLKALKTMLFCGLDAPVLVPGPFGTGKTRLLSVASEYLITRAKDEKIPARILLCCHQQNSADLFMKDYFMRMSFDGLVVRVTSLIHHKAGKPSDESNCEIVPCDQFIKDIKRYQSQDRIVIVTTYLTALRMHQVIGQDYFTHILIDEGAQAREPECIAPLGMAGDQTRIIIVGDSKQVGPKLVVLGDDVQNNGLGVSLLERLHKTYERIPTAKKYYTVTLRNNYRCVPGILTLPSDLFYESSLVPCSKARVVSGKSAPLEFICSSLSPSATVGCESKVEAEIIIEELRKLLFHHRIHFKRICVMSSSQRQSSLINKEMRLNKLPWVKTLSTYQMQGQEFDVLILSTVESTFSNGMPFDPLKSLCHPAVFNTAITRARSLIIVVGNPIALKRGENEIKANPKGCWKKFISTCEENGAYRVHTSQCVPQPKTPLATTTTIRQQRFTAYDDSAIGHHNSSSLPSSITASTCKEKPKSIPTPCPPPVHLNSRVAWKTVDKPKTCLGSNGVASVPNEHFNSNKQSVHEMNPPIKKVMVQTTPHVDQSTNRVRNVPSSKLGNNVLGQPLKYKDNSFMSNTGRKRNQKKATPSRRFMKPAFVIEEYSEEFPSLEESKNMSSKDIEKHKQKSEEVIVERQKFRHDHRQLNQELLKEKLTRQNYREKFHQLLCREEEEHEKILKNRCDGIYKLHLDEDSHKLCANEYAPHRTNYNHIRFGYITADHLNGDKAAYAEQASERRLIIEFTAYGKRIELELDLVGSNSLDNSHLIILGFEESHSNYFGMVYYNAKVTFVLKYSYFDRLHQALDRLSDSVLKKILPESPDDFEVSSRHSGTYMCPEVQPFVWLDDKQDKKPRHQTFSLRTILKSNQSKVPILVVGSFGTGKTRLLARAAYQILRNNPRANVLVCAHHQRSADTFIDNYFGKMIENNWTIGNGIIPIRLIPKNSYRVSCDSYRKYYKTIDEIRKLHKSKLKLVLTTYSSSHLLNFLKKWHFTHLLLDEGAQTREPEAIIPLSLVDENATIVVAGDHKQVGPSILVLGDIPRKNGLKRSLLERLHNLYHEDERLKDVSDSHCATLLTNYRSHHALLSLPSYLFYGSALVTVAEASNLLHPGAPHPLKFVCSSLDDNVAEVISSINENEIKLIVNQVQEYIHKWPSKKLGYLRQSDLCIMATTPDQKHKFRQKICKHHKDIKNIEILTVYDIQGREFQAIFLSTAEPITEHGRSKNPTKSPCGQYVFNTAITRAKSHVICAGNPFLLMRVEKTMDNVDDEKSFWKDYFRRCIITKSFIVPSSIKHSSNLEKLQKRVFENDSKKFHPLNSHTPSDSIMKRLEQLLATRYKIDQCKILIQEQNKEYYSANWKVAIEEEDSQSDPSIIEDTASSDSSKKKICDLEIKSSRRAIAIPQESQQESIVINGYHNRQGAFNGDVVEISLMGHDEEGTKYGKVVQVKEFNHPMKYVCTADHKDVIFFYPIDKKVPSIVNLPKLSRSILRHKREELNELQKEYITVFEESSLDADKDLSLKIKELIPLSMGPSLLFVVKVLSWSPKFRKPLGAVIEALPRTNNLFITEKLLSIAHDIQEESRYQDPSPNQDENHSISPCSNGVLPHKYLNAITIDPNEAFNFDDAVTIIPLDESTYELAVLIIDVTEYIKKDSELDEIARRKGTSVYPGHQTGSRCKMIPMLPLDFTQSKLSLQDKRPVIVVSAKVKIQADSTTGDDVIVIDSAIVKKSVLEDPVNLTYGSAQLIMNDDSGMNTELKEKMRKFDYSNTFCLKKTLHLLFKVAMKLRMNRLNDAAYNYRISDPKEETSWQAHLLVEELMIWANSEIANYVIKERPDVGVIRCQPPPLSSELSKFCDTHRKFISLSLSLRDVPLSPEPITCKGLLVTSDVIEKLRQAYCSKNTQEFVRILSQESNFPQLSIVEDALISISQRAKYTFINPSSDEIVGRHNLYSHHSIKRIYTHFSSPIRRYIDMIVHRIAKALLEKEDMPYQKEELLKLCRDLNLKTRNAKQYSKNIDRAQSSSKWEDEGMKKTVAYINTSIFKKQKFHLCFQDGQIDEFMKRDDSTFDFSHLTYHKRDKDMMITWQVMSVPLNGPGYLTECPSLRAINSDDGDGLMKLKAKVYPASKDNGRCLKEHVVSIVDNNRIIPLEEWQLAQKCVTEPTQKYIDSFFMSSCFSDEGTSNAVENEQASRLFRSDATNSPLIMYSVEARLDVGYPVNVWLGKSTREPFSSPSLHMIEVSPTVRICLMHVQDPSSCFSNHQLRRTFDTDDLVEYVDVWCNALLAEACHDCVKTKTITILKGAHLNWPNLVKSETSIDKIYYKPMESPSLEISLEKYDMMDFINIHVGDLVCARYETQQGNQEVYHFYVKRIEEQKDIHRHQESQSPGKMIVYFDSYGEHGCKISEKMKKLLKDESNPLRCDLQIIKAPISFLRVFQRLQYLKREEHSVDKSGASTHRTWKELAKAVASVQRDKLRSEPVLMNEYLKVLEEDILAKFLWETENKGKQVKQLNTKQIEAIKSALKYRFQLIQGPPGTGKSVTGAHLAYIFAIANKKSKNRKKVLYCGPSNKAVDVVHYQLIKVNKKLPHENKKLPHETQKLKILRLYGRTHEAKDYPNPIMEVMGLDYEEKLDSMCPEELKSYALHHKIRQKNSELKNMEEKLLSMKLDGKIPCLTERQKYKECLLESEAQEMQTSYDVILCTCNETCSARILQACTQELNSDEQKPPSPLMIGQVIVDECGMAHEPETIAAISRCEHAVLIGDHMQLQPVVKHTPAKNCGLNKSLFQRYAEREDIDHLIRLDTQYRMHQCICEAPSNMFYDGNLKPDNSVKMRKPLGRLNDFFKPDGYPVRFFDIEGKEESGMADDSVSFKTNVDVHSKFNISEAEKAVEVINDIRALVNSKEASIAVLTPYAAQKDTINKLLKKKNIHKVKVLSIVESQGDEYDVVIISTVRTLPRKQIRVKKYVQPDRKWRTENLGFLIDSHQLNVAITRAKHGLIIIGNRMLLEYDEDGWGKLIEIYNKAGLIVRED